MSQLRTLGTLLTSQIYSILKFTALAINSRPVKYVIKQVNACREKESMASGSNKGKKS